MTFEVIYDKAKVGNYKVTATVIDTRGKSTSKQFSITVIQPTYEFEVSEECKPTIKCIGPLFGCPPTLTTDSKQTVCCSDGQ